MVNLNLPLYLNFGLVSLNLCPLLMLFYRERDNFEAELKELKRRYETVDLSHAAVTRERDTLSKEVHHTYFSL